MIGKADKILLQYLRGEISEGAASKELNLDRLDFRENLGEWLRDLMDAAPVAVKGWTSALYCPACQKERVK